MNTSLTISPSASLALTCLAAQREIGSKTFLHRPGDIIPVNIELHKHRALEALSLHGFVVGETRVWAHPSDNEDLYQTMIHTHLNQAASFSHMLPVITNTRVGAILDMPLMFVLPELCTENRGTKTNSRIPPSCELGSLYLDPWGRTYMQPFIEYSLRITLRFRLAGETEIRTISAQHPIRVTTAPHCDPPMYTESNSGARSVITAVDVRRSRFAKPFAELSAAMAEPPPVVGNGVGGRCRTMAQLQLTWETSSEAAYDEFELGKRLIKIDYQLLARTRFGTKAVDWNGGKRSDEVRPHKSVETMDSGTFELRAVDRNIVRTRINGIDGRRCHTGSIAIPIQVNDRTVPTFSHGLASHDYVLLVKVQIQGLQHATLSLRVPIQICESTVDNNFSECESLAKVYGKMISTEALPSYEDHRYNLIP